MWLHNCFCGSWSLSSQNILEELGSSQQDGPSAAAASEAEHCDATVKVGVADGAQEPRLDGGAQWDAVGAWDAA